MYYLLQLLTHKKNHTEKEYDILYINSNNDNQIHDLMIRITDFYSANGNPMGKKLIHYLLSNFIKKETDNKSLKDIQMEMIKDMKKSYIINNNHDFVIPNYNLIKLGGTNSKVQFIPTIVPRSIYNRIKNSDLKISHISYISHTQLNDGIRTRVYFKTEDGIYFSIKSGSENPQIVYEEYYDHNDEHIKLKDFFMINDLLMEYRDELIFMGINYRNKKIPDGKTYYIHKPHEEVFDIYGNEMLLVREEGVHKKSISVPIDKFTELYSPL